MLLFYWTLYTLKSVCIISILFTIHLIGWWKGEFVYQSTPSLAGDHLLYSRDFHFWIRADTASKAVYLHFLLPWPTNKGEAARKARRLWELFQLLLPILLAALPRVLAEISSLVAFTAQKSPLKYQLALHKYRKGHGFKSRLGLNFFQVLFFTTSSVVFLVARIS